MSTPSREDFAAMLDESFITQSPAEGSVVKGIIVAVESDFVIVDVGLKTEGRVALKEFASAGANAQVKVGDEVEVYLERVENALGEAVISRDKARREESWVKLEKAFETNEKVDGVIFNQVKGGFTVDLDGAVAFLPRSQVDIRPVRDVTPLMNVPTSMFNCSACSESLPAAMSRVSSGLGNFAMASRPSGKATADFGRAPPSGEPWPRRKRRSCAVSDSPWTASAAFRSAASCTSGGIFPSRAARNGPAAC